MTTQFTGIENANEFYTSHYLAAIMAGDLKSEVFKQWSEQASEAKSNRQPHQKLRSLHGDFFDLKKELEDTDDPTRRVQLHRQFATSFLHALGYDATPTLRTTDDGHIPLLAEVTRADGAPVLWCLQAITPNPGDPQDPLNLTLLPDQYTDAATNQHLLPDGPQPSTPNPQPSTHNPIEELVSQQIFARPEPPRFLILFGETQILLLDRTKWREKRLLRFDLVEILGRKETDTLKVAAALLHRQQIWSGDQQSLLDTLDDSSHKHAFSVSEDLKYALRGAIELLGNEALWYIQHVKKQKRFDLGDKFDDRLTRECLRYMYRLLFLFYIEARPELGYAPMGNDAYRKGYSLETLRELEMVELTTDESLDGYYIHQSLDLLFELIHEGANPAQQQDLTAWTSSPKTQQETNAQKHPSPSGGGASRAVTARGGGGATTSNNARSQTLHGEFTLVPLRSHLFDPEKTPILNSVKLRNKVTQRIIELMSLSRADGSGRKRKRRGRISYAQLGINQLGAVYEALLSYRGFFAEDDLYEVKKKKDTYDPLETAYFVTRDELDKYADKEIVKNEDGSLKHHPKGTFIYRLAGRDREKSASYYTPESLTKCLVKYALKELLGEGIAPASMAAGPDTPSAPSGAASPARGGGGLSPAPQQPDEAIEATTSLPPGDEDWGYLLTRLC